MAVFCSLEGATCKSCIPKTDTAEELERAKLERESKGCEKPTVNPQYGDDETGELFYRCPISQVEEESWAMVGLYNFVDQGFLPHGGGILDQPAHILERLKIVRNAKIEWKKKHPKGK